MGISVSCLFLRKSARESGTFTLMSQFIERYWLAVLYICVVRRLSCCSSPLFSLRRLDHGSSRQSQARRPVPPRSHPLLPPSARPRRVPVRGRRRGGGAGQGGLAEAQDHRRLLHPRGQRGGLRHPDAGPEVPGVEPGHGPLLRRQGLRGGGHTRHLLRAHPPRGLRAAGLAVPRRWAVAEVPVRRPRRHARGHRNARRRHHRHGLLPARRARQEGHGRSPGRRRRGHVGSSRARRPLPWRVSRRRVIRGGVRRRRRRAAHPPACHLAGAGAGDHSALGDHRHVTRRIPEHQHDQTTRGRANFPPVLRRDRARRMHCSGQVPPEVRAADGALLLTHYAGWRGDRHRDILRLRREQPQHPDHPRDPQRRRRRNPQLHGSRGPPRRRLHEP